VASSRRRRCGCRSGCGAVFADEDATLVEVNPLILTSDGLRR
jgi:hypothetical protein